MRCVICKTGEARDGHATVTLERNGTVVIVKGVPAEVCDNCGEYYLAQQTAARVYARADDAVQRKAELEIVNYAA
jgi:YgiT-type zinc finger domain-containing protein